MICAPRQTIMLCVAALIVNAAASELKDPARSLMSHLAGSLPFAVENGKVQHRSAWNRSAGEILRSIDKASAGLAKASEKLADGDYSAFIEELKRTAAAPDDPGAWAARFIVAENAFGNKEWQKAYPLYSALRNENTIPPQLVFQATIRALESLIRSGDDKTALRLLQSTAEKYPEKQRVWEELQIFLLGRSGNHSELAKLWETVKEKHPHAPEPFLYEGLCEGGDAAAAAGEFRVAERFYADAFNYAPDHAGRRNSLKKLILLQEKEDPERALRTVDRYILFFPVSADAGKVLLRKGEILIGLKRFTQALDLYREILNNKKYTIEDRLQAAFRAAAVSEQNGNISVAREFYNSAIRRFSGRPEIANRVKMQLLEFLIRTREFSSAVMLGEELAGLYGVDQERLNIFRLKALTMLKRYADAVVIASELANSSDPVRASEGAWQLARLKELQGENKEAQSLYLTFSERFPKDQRVPDALLAVADFSMKEKAFGSAYRKLEEYLQKFPQHPGVRKAMAVAVFALLHQDLPGNREKAEQLFQKLEKSFPGSDECDQAALELIRYFSRHDETAAAVKQLDDFLKKRSGSPLVPEVLLMGGKLFEKMGGLGKAVEYVDRLLDKFPNSPLAVEAAMLGGSCCFQQSNYGRALKYYERACELGGRGVMAQVAAGEAADCHLQLQKKENLIAAIRIYGQLARQSEFPPLQVQALYKLGVAHELNNDSMKALEAYEELLSLAVGSEKVRQSSGAAAWCARSARSGLRIILGNPHLPDGSQRAQRLYRLYSLLELPGSSSELRRYLEEIRKHYNLLD